MSAFPIASIPGLLTRYDDIKAVADTCRAQENVAVQFDNKNADQEHQHCC